MSTPATLHAKSTKISNMETDKRGIRLTNVIRLWKSVQDNILEETPLIVEDKVISAILHYSNTSTNLCKKYDVDSKAYLNRLTDLVIHIRKKIYSITFKLTPNILPFEELLSLASGEKMTTFLTTTFTEVSVTDGPDSKPKMTLEFERINVETVQDGDVFEVETSGPPVVTGTGSNGADPLTNPINNNLVMVSVNSTEGKAQAKMVYSSTTIANGIAQVTGIKSSTGLGYTTRLKTPVIEGQGLMKVIPLHSKGVRFGWEQPDQSDISNYSLLWSLKQLVTRNRADEPEFGSKVSAVISIRSIF